MITRRNLAALSGAVALAACSSTTITPVQVVADAQGLVTTIKATIAAIVASSPNAIPATLQADLAQAAADATTALASLSTLPTPASTATVLQVVEAYLNPAMAAVGAVLQADPVLNAKYGIIFNAAQALIVGVIEPYIAQVLATGTAPAPNPAFSKQRAIVGVH